MSVFRGIDGFHAEAKLSTWLHRIVVNVALMKLRRERCTPERHIEELLPTFAEDGHTVPAAEEWRGAEQVLERKELCGLVQRCIDQLPDSSRIVLVLRDIEDLDTEQAAQLLGITAGAVKVRLHRARLALRGLLDPHLRLDFGIGVIAASA